MWKRAARPPRMRPWSALVRAGVTLMTAGALALAGPAPIHAEDVAGRLVLLTKDGKGPARDADPRLAVAYYQPAPTAAVIANAAGTFQLLARRLQLVPHVQAVPVGSRVRFPNQDSTPHNLFSASPGNSFDLGVVPPGAVREQRFEQGGLVRVFCNLHPSMVAYILVLDTPFYAAPAADGSFRLTGLPKGAGKLIVWHERADPWSTDLALPQRRGEAPIQARLVVARPGFPPHLNKLGEPYPRR
jgi:plastocyanin